MSGVEAMLEVFGNSVLIWFGIFTRVAAAAFLLPSIGEHAIPARVKLGAAMAFSAIIIPIVAPGVPPVSATATGIGHMVLTEAAAGLFIGVSLRLLVFALQTAGTIAAQNLSISQMFGGAMGADPEPVITNLLTMAAIAAALAAGLHVKIAMALADSYDVIAFGGSLNASDLGFWSAERGNAAFDLAIGLALPFVVIAFIYNLSLGVINRAMPQMMVAFVGAPAIALMGIGLLLLTIPIILRVWIEHLDTVLAAPFGIAS